MTCKPNSNRTVLCLKPVLKTVYMIWIPLNEFRTDTKELTKIGQDGRDIMFILVTNHHSKKQAYVNVDSITMILQSEDHGEIQFQSEQQSLITTETAEEIIRLIEHNAKKY